jgi:predicted AAA+ superfamily ATPase
MGIADILSAYERVHKVSFATLTRPLVIFIDETQLDPNWQETLDMLYSGNDKIFIIAVGTPVLAHKNAKEALKNTKFETLHPMSSTEYLKIKKQKHKIPGLSGAIRDAILHSPDSDSLYASLQIIAPEVNTYYKGSILGDFYAYLLYGSLPQMLYSENESYSFDHIQKTLDRILAKDLFGAKFHPDTVALIPKILREITENDVCNIKKLSEHFDLSRLKMSEILDVLELSGLLRRIYPHGTYFQEVVSRKPSKYLFATPAFRMPWYRIFADVLKNENTKSKIVQDIVAMYLYRAFDRNKKGMLTYDADV